MKSVLPKLILILTLFCSTLFAGFPSTQLVFAQENLDEFTITNCQVNIADIDKYNYINIHSDYITIASSELNMITSIVNDNIQNFNNYGTNDGQIIAPKFSKRIAGNQIAIYDINRIQIFDNDFNYIKRFAYINDNPLPLALGTVVSMCADYSGNIYMLDKTNNMVLKINTANDIIEKITLNTQTVTITDNSQISVNANGDKLALINCAENNFVYDLSNQNLQNINSNSYDDVLFDCMDNLFLIKKTDTTQITKIACGDYTTSLTKEISITYNYVDIDIETGNLYLLSDQIYKVQNEQFFANASTEISPVDITSTVAHDNALIVCTTKNNAKLYSTCVSFASSIVLTNNTKVVVLQSEMPQNKNMSYCLVAQNENEMTGYIETKNLLPLETSVAETEYKTICQNVNILSYPSQNAGIVQTIANDEKVLIVTGNAGDYLDSNNQRYYEVKIDGKIAYVEQRFLVKTDLVEIEKTQTTPIETNQGQFIALVLAVVCLFVVTLFVCYIIGRKSKAKN